MKHIIFTDVSTDGMLTGPNFKATAAMCAAVRCFVIASGGVTNLDDVKSLCSAESDGIVGAITGRAIYEGTLSFSQAQKLADQLSSNA